MGSPAGTGRLGVDLSRSLTSAVLERVTLSQCYRHQHEKRVTESSPQRSVRVHVISCGSTNVL